MRISSRCFIFKDDKIVLIYRENQGEIYYVFPGGKVEDGETNEQCVVREVKEELGLDVSELEFVQTYPYIKKEMLMIGFHATVKKANFTLSKEVDKAEWVKLEQALDKLREGSIAWQLVNQVIKKSRKQKE